MSELPPAAHATGPVGDGPAVGVLVDAEVGVEIPTVAIGEEIPAVAVGVGP
jgi:hypothetical protein